MTLTTIQWNAFRIHMLSRQDLKPSTVKKTLLSLAAMERAGVDLLADSEEGYDAFMAHLKEQGRRGAGLQHYAKAMRRLLRWRGVDRDVPMPHASPAEVELLPRRVVHDLVHLGEDQPDDLRLAVARFSYQVIHYVGLLAPLEPLALRLEHYNPRSHQIRAYRVKTDKWRTLRLEAWLAKLFDEWIDGPRARIDKWNCPALIPTPKGLPWRPETYRGFLDKVARRIHPTWSPYDGRHWALSTRQRAWRDIYRTMRWAGHADTRPTVRYVHLGEEYEAEAGPEQYAPLQLAELRDDVAAAPSEAWPFDL